MKKFNFIFGTILTIMLLLQYSCRQDTFVMYDEAQKPHLYFTKFDAFNIPQFSMVISSEDTYTYYVDVQIIGSPVDYDRVFELELHTDTMTMFKTGGISQNVVSARWNTDVSIGELVIPRNQIAARVPLIIHRQAVMAEKLVSALITVKEDANFRPMTPNYFRLLISDSDLTQPKWWANHYISNPIPGWSRYLGTFSPEKYRRFLNLFWAAEAEQPDFVRTTIESYGEYLYDASETVKAGFYMLENATLWAHYVAIPLYDYCKANPIPGDCAFVETGEQGTYWQDPRGMIR